MSNSQQVLDAKHRILLQCMFVENDAIMKQMKLSGVEYIIEDTRST